MLDGVECGSIDVFKLTLPRFCDFRKNGFELGHWALTYLAENFIQKKDQNSEEKSAQQDTCLQDQLQGANEKCFDEQL